MKDGRGKEEDAMLQKHDVYLTSRYHALVPLSLPKQAEANPEVQRRIQSHIPILQDFVLKILKKLQATIEEVPFGIRWLCKATRSLVQEKFSEASADQVNAFIGGFFFLRYINPLIATPHGM